MGDRDGGQPGRDRVPVCEPQAEEQGRQLNKVMQHIIPGFKGAYDEGETEATKQLENAIDDAGDGEGVEDDLVDSDIDAELDDLDLDDEVETPKSTSTNIPNELDDEPLPIDIDDDDLE